MKRQFNERAVAILMNDQPFRKGDAVRLRFGRRTMTVLEIDGDGANCLTQGVHGQQMIWAAWECLVPAKQPPNFKLLHSIRSFAGLL